MEISVKERDGLKVNLLEKSWGHFSTILMILPNRVGELFKEGCISTFTVSPTNNQNY